MKKRGGKTLRYITECVCVTDVFMNIHTHVSRQQKLKYKYIRHRRRRRWRNNMAVKIYTA